MTRSILQEADTLVNGDRLKAYGDPIKKFKEVALLASILCGKELSAQDIIKVMVAVKLSREGHKPKRDNRVDACGYLELLDRVEAAKK